MKQAVCFFFRRDDGKVLAISRTPKTGVVGDLAIPGGKVEPGETLLTALRREVLEEAGVLVYSPHQVFFGIDPTGFFVTTFAGDIDPLLARSGPEGEISWVFPRELVAPHCTFRDYNLALLRVMGVDV